jgi:hypothetical protein
VQKRIGALFLSAFVDKKHICFLKKQIYRSPSGRISRFAKMRLQSKYIAFAEGKHLAPL